MPEPQGDCGRSNEVGAATVFVVTDIAKSTAHYPRRARLNGGDVAYWPLADMADRFAVVRFPGWSGPSADGLRVSACDPKRTCVRLDLRLENWLRSRVACPF